MCFGPNEKEKDHAYVRITAVRDPLSQKEETKSLPPFQALNDDDMEIFFAALEPLTIVL
jgi:hypothetical protein